MFLKIIQFQHKNGFKNHFVRCLHFTKEENDVADGELLRVGPGPDSYLRPSGLAQDLV